MTPMGAPAEPHLSLWVQGEGASPKSQWGGGAIRAQPALCSPPLCAHFLLSVSVSRFLPSIPLSAPLPPCVSLSPALSHLLSSAALFSPPLSACLTLSLPSLPPSLFLSVCVSLCPLSACLSLPRSRLSPPAQPCPPLPFLPHACSPVLAGPAQSQGRLLAPLSIALCFCSHCQRACACWGSWFSFCSVTSWRPHGLQVTGQHAVEASPAQLGHA